MSKNYDNWEKLVGAVLKKEQLRRIALSDSWDSSDLSSSSSCSSFNSNTCLFHHHQFLVYKGLIPPPVEPYFDHSVSERSVPLNINHDIISRSMLGKYVFLPVEARELTISSLDFPERQFSYISSLNNSSCFEVVKVDSVLSLDIRGRIKTRLLTPGTIYGAYLLFTSAESLKGLDSAKGMIRFVNSESDGDAEMRADTVHLQPVDERKGEIAVMREDGLMEVQIGNFYIDDHEGDDEEVEARLMKTSRWKMGLVVGGIEFRPLVCVRRATSK